jgi:PAS domain S-box-containing protein
MHDLSLSILELMDFLPGVVFSTEPGGEFRLRFISDSVADLLGYTREELVADPAMWLELVYADDRDEVRQGLHMLPARKNFSQEYRLVNCSGDSLWVRAQMKLVADVQDRPLGIVGLWTDINEQHLQQEKVEQELRASEERFMKAFQLSPVLMAITDLHEGTYLEVNDAFINTLGYKREDVLGKRAGEVDIFVYPHSRKKFL